MRQFEQWAAHVERFAYARERACICAKSHPKALSERMATCPGGSVATREKFGTARVVMDRRVLFLQINCLAGQERMDGATT